MMSRARVLHIAAEVFPLIKTGGLADVVGALPKALRNLDVDARILVPGYPDVLATMASHGHFEVLGPSLGAIFGAARVQIMRGRLPSSEVPVYVIDAPWLYQRPGNPYVDAAGHPWPDNYLRFGLLGLIGAQFAGGDIDPQWSPQILHAHDWHAGLALVYLAQHPAPRARSVFTIHNLAFQGRFPLDCAGQLGFIPAQVTPQMLEFHGDVSFMKGALMAADAITTVSPTYAREILTFERGEGLDGVLGSRAERLSGILNGVDTVQWNPAHDPLIAHPYDSTTLAAKESNKTALRKELGLRQVAELPLFAVVGRLTAQKGLDLLLESLNDPALGEFQLAILGTGESGFERAFSALANARAGTVAARIVFDEALSHRVFAGADAILVPSRFEPCGLTQLYGLRYGAVPIVRRVGGLADTVIDEQAGTSGNGFVFDDAHATALTATMQRALRVYRDRSRWQALMQSGMRQALSWERPAAAYQALYDNLMTL
jgi:starch synthase